MARGDGKNVVYEISFHLFYSKVFARRCVYLLYARRVGNREVFILYCYNRLITQLISSRVQNIGNSISKLRARDVRIRRERNNNAEPIEYAMITKDNSTNIILS